MGAVGSAFFPATTACRSSVSGRTSGLPSSGKGAGGLPADVKTYLADCGEKYSKIKVGRGPEVRLLPGTSLIREWDRQEYRVTVLPDGSYELNGQRYRSLSAAARAITGTHWSGPAFFGVKGGRK